MATEDEGRRPTTTMEALADLKTPFRPHGKVTAGNASPLTDGATVSALASEDVARELGLGAKMRMVSFGFAGVEPEVMGIGPIPSTEKALAKAGLSIDDIGLFELNEAFAVQVLSLLDHFGIDDEDPRVNPWGGAIALGHPLAASGVRLMIQLARQFEMHPEVRFSLTAMCGAWVKGKRDLGKPALHRSEVMAKSAVAQYDSLDVAPLLAHAKDEVVTHSFVRYVPLPKPVAPWLSSPSITVKTTPGRILWVLRAWSSFVKHCGASKGSRGGIHSGCRHHGEPLHSRCGC